MKISNSTINYIHQAYSHLKPNTGDPSAPKPEKYSSETMGDSINLSDRTKDLQRIEKALDIDPTARQEQVAHLKERVEQGRYTVDAEKVASKMAGTFMDELV